MKAASGYNIPELFADGFELAGALCVCTILVCGLNLLITLLLTLF